MVTSTKQIILASTSPYRKALLTRLQLPFEVHAPVFDESRLKQSTPDISKLAQSLAQSKAEEVGQHFPQALIIGGDQIAEIHGAILDKPQTPQKARQQLSRLAGQTHSLWTAVALHNPQTGQTESACEQHRLTMRQLTPMQIARYVEQDRPLDCAGSYRIESLGIALFSSIEGNDFTAIIGLPLIQLVSLLQRFGLEIPWVGEAER